ncbi:cytidine deaminase family protein [Lacicoccus alkaliphilus]|uniref:Cytidine deaminase n=1 Tax=Lacicoccus alkaliphilus DSM 16010 TaxID=1123231 RepID=A0A1M7B0U3_9BACL|nr:cytidine deaminase [Salinicoccus alkaliphilus]SHL48603.1 Cytidine deaminase [Salinicoccus alkaliphilus DSM 16010]
MSFEDLYTRAKEVRNRRELTKYATVASVGAALLAENGKVYTGVSIVTDCGTGFCAEHSAVAAMVTDGESRILQVVAAGKNGSILPPCGRCREFISQIHLGNMSTEVMIGKDKILTIKDLLPYDWKAVEAHTI